LKATGLAALDGLKELEVDSKTNAATLEIDLAQHKLAPGFHTFYLQTQTKGKYRNNPEAAKEAAEAAQQAEKLAADLSAESKKAVDALAAASKTRRKRPPRPNPFPKAKNPRQKQSQDGSEAKAWRRVRQRKRLPKPRKPRKKKVGVPETREGVGRKAKPRDVTVTVYSTPITFQVKAADNK